MNATVTTMGIKQILVALGITTLAIIGIGLISYSLNYVGAEKATIAEISSTGTVTYTLSPPSLNLQPGITQTVSLVVDSGTQKLGAANFALTFDATKLNVTNLKVGTWLTTKLKDPTIASGTTGLISGILGATPDDTLPGGGPELSRTGTGTLITFDVSPKVNGIFAIDFDQHTSEAIIIGSQATNLKTTTGITITAKLITDIIGDTRKVDLYDYTEFLRQYGSAGSADFNGSGAVDIYDYTRFLQDYGKTW